MKLIFMGTPDFSVPALEALINDGHEVLAVYTKAPRPAGRGQKEQKSAIHMVAEKHNIEVRTPKSLKDTQEQELFAQTGAQMAVVVAYGLILPKPILDSCYCINIHASILPRWRGAAPIERAILAGDKETGVTIMQMDEGLDTGSMLIWNKVAINSDTTAGQLHDSLSEIGAKLIVNYINNKGNIIPIEQEGEATYAQKIDKSEAKLNCSENASVVSAQINAFAPLPGAYFYYNDEKFKIFKASFDIKEHGFEVGQIIDRKCSIALKDGVLHPKIIQRQGKKVMPISDLVRGFEFSVGNFVK